MASGLLMSHRGRPPPQEPETKAQAFRKRSRPHICRPSLQGHKLPPHFQGYKIPLYNFVYT